MFTWAVTTNEATDAAARADRRGLLARHESSAQDNGPDLDAASSRLAHTMQIALA